MMAKTSPINTKNAAILRALQHLSPEQRRLVISKGDKSLIKCIAECALNVLKGNVSINKSHKKKLRNYAAHLRKLTSKKRTLQGRKKIIVQKGGGLLTALLPVLATVLAQYIK